MPGPSFLRRFGQIALGFSLVAALSGSPAGASSGGVELHAHLFMEEGMTWGFKGDFFGPLQADSWKDKFASMANPESVERSGIRVLVATLYAHPLFVWSLRDSIRRQIALAERFVTENPDWVLAKSPDEARRALSAGKRVLILALEGASGILETEEDLREFVDQKGIRIVGLLHLTDDHYGGVAFLRGIRGLASPWAWIKNRFQDLVGTSPDKHFFVNRNGLTDEGRKMAESLLKRGVWLDLAHSSDAAQRDLMPLLKRTGQPLLHTHSVLRHYHGAERGISLEQLRAVGKSGGIIGLMPSEEYLQGTPFLPRGCTSAIFALVQQYREISEIIGSEAIMMGSDYNGGLPHLSPSCGTGTELDREGLWNIGQVSTLWEALERLGAPVPKPVDLAVKRFVDTWEKAAASQSR